jgi:GWxTD domain-containing protein
LTRSFALTATGLLAGLLLLPSLQAAKKSVDLEDWVKGPIRYIALKAEMIAFKELETDTSRALYIEKFWSLRDPTPETMVNEYRQLFWERVKQANDNFVDSTKPGWMTDRGKIHILYGPPTEIQEEPHLAPETSPSSGHGVIRWIYEGRPGQRMDLDAIVVVPFVRDVSGEYRLDYDPKLSSVFFDANAIREKRTQSLDKFLGMMNAHSNSQLSVMLDLGRLQEVPPQEQVLLERVETMEAYESYELRVKVDRYLHPVQRQTVVAITVDLSDTGEGGKPTIVARLVPFDATKKPRLLGEDSFRLAAPQEPRLAQARISLDPGNYTLTVMLADTLKVRTGLFKGTVMVPEPSDRLRFSDIVWASRLESLPYAALASHDEPFHVGPFRVLPNFEARYLPGDTAKLFYEVYGGLHPLHVSYQLQGKEDDGSWIDLGKPSVSDQSVTSYGWELQTSPNWPLGEYRIVIDVRDSEGRVITSGTHFVLEQSEGP